MKNSLAKSLNLEEIDWNDILLRAELGKFSFSENPQILRNLQKWETCSCGQLSVHIPRDTNYHPEDGQLTDLGEEIYDSVVDNRYANARNLLEMLKVREIYILKCLKDEVSQRLAENIKQIQTDKKLLKELSE